MCLSTVYKADGADAIQTEVLMEYVSKIEVKGNLVTLTDVMGDQRTVEGAICMADLTGGVVKISC